MSAVSTLSYRSRKQQLLDVEELLKSQNCQSTWCRALLYGGCMAWTETEDIEKLPQSLSSEDWA
ncbi:hypothetical protein AAUPMC_04254 [Pasteurella multocida subsp. multocida str. Anand1_cattle]|nr:hypothetical protein AAUPMC_04254 [Pasteurella multocida subsp. multocida str. Anand1_cattle]